MAKRTTKKTAKKTTKTAKKSVRKTKTTNKTTNKSANKSATRKTPRKKTTKRKTTRKSPARSPNKVAQMIETPESIAINRQALWNTYRDLQSRVDRALDKLRMHFNTRAMPHVLLEDKNELLFLLGECNYMARTCAELDSSDEHAR